MKKALQVFFIIVLDILSFMTVLFTLMVVLPVSMTIVLIHKSIVNFSLVKGFLAADEFIGNRVIAWGDRLKLIRAGLGMLDASRSIKEAEETLATIEEMEHALNLSLEFDQLLKDIDSDDHQANIERVIKFLNDNEVDERWEVKK